MTTLPDDDQDEAELLLREVRETMASAPKTGSIEQAWAVHYVGLAIMLWREHRRVRARRTVT